MTDSVLRQLSTRFKTDWLNNEHLRPIYSAFGRVESAAEKLRAKRDEIAKSTTLTDIGKFEALRAFAAKEVVPALRTEPAGLEDSLSRMSAHRQKLATPEVNRSDTVGAMQRQEIRSFLRGLTDGQRNGLLLNNPDAQTLAAVMEMPAVMSGLTDDMRTKVQDVQLKKQHANILELHDNAEQAIAITDSAIKITLNEIRRDGGFESNPHAFDVWMETITDAIDKKPAAQLSHVSDPAPAFAAY